MLLLSVANLIFMYHIALRDLKVLYTAVISILVMVAGVMLQHSEISKMVNAILYTSVIVVVINVSRTIWWNIRTLKTNTGATT
jgi:hypothetical protein